MKVDGVAVVENVKATVIDPANEKHDLAVDAGEVRIRTGKKVRRGITRK